jgi:hypothetical protein
MVDIMKKLILLLALFGLSFSFLEDNVYVFDNIEQARSAAYIAPGFKVETRGYYAPFDGGGATYEVVNLAEIPSAIDSGYVQPLGAARALVQVLNDDYLRASTYGVVCGVQDSARSNFLKLNNLFNTASSNAFNVRFNSCVDTIYVQFVSDTLKISNATLPGKMNITGVGRDATILKAVNSSNYLWFDADKADRVNFTDITVIGNFDPAPYGFIGGMNQHLRYFNDSLAIDGGDTVSLADLKCCDSTRLDQDTILVHYNGGIITKRDTIRIPVPDAGANPSGPDGSIQFNRSDTLAGTDSLKWDYNSGVLTVNGAIVSPTIDSLIRKGDSVVIVAQDGSGDYTRIAPAVAYVQSKSPGVTGPWYIEIRPGNYAADGITVDSSNIHFYSSVVHKAIVYDSSGADGFIITGNNVNFSDIKFIDQNSGNNAANLLYQSGSSGRVFNCTFENTIGGNMQGFVEARDMDVEIINCRFWTNGGGGSTQIAVNYSGKIENCYFDIGGTAISMDSGYIKNCFVTNGSVNLYGADIIVEGLIASDDSDTPLVLAGDAKIENSKFIGGFGNNGEVVQIQAGATNPQLFNCDFYYDRNSTGLHAGIQFNGGTGATLINCRIGMSDFGGNYAIENISATPATLTLKGTNVYGLVDYTNLTINGLSDQYIDASTYQIQPEKINLNPTLESDIAEAPLEITEDAGGQLISANDATGNNLFRLTDTATIFNGGGTDNDFRVYDGIGNSLIFGDAGLSRVGIGSPPIGKTFEVNGLMDVYYNGRAVIEREIDQTIFTGGGGSTGGSKFYITNTTGNRVELSWSAGGLTFGGAFMPLTIGSRDLSINASIGLGGSDFTWLMNSVPAFRIEGSSFGTRMKIENNVSTAADESAQLEIASTTRGFLPPRMTNAQRDAITSPAEGLMVFSTTDSTVYVRRNTSWLNLGLTGAGGTDDQILSVDSTTLTPGVARKFNISIENGNTIAFIDSIGSGGAGDPDQTLSWNGTTGELTISGSGGNTVDLDGRYLQSFTETNDLTAAVTWANVPDANITQSSVTQHQAALTITESQISDLQAYLTAEVDGDISNEGSLTVAAGAANTSIINSNTSGSTGVTITAGTGLSIAEAGNVITLTNTVTNTDAQTLSWASGTGQLTISGGNSISLDGRYLTSFTETNDLTAAVTWANVPDANITQSSVTQHQAALSITESQISDLQAYLTAEVDGSTTNELQSLSHTSGPLNHKATLSDGGGSLEIIQGTGIDVTTSGTGSDGVVTITNTGVITETNNLTQAVTWANVPDANITQSSVTQHQAALTITESQISDLSHTNVAANSGNIQFNRADTLSGTDSLNYDYLTGGLDLIGDVFITYNAAIPDEHALEIDVNANGIGDIKAIDIAYNTGTLTTGNEEAIILLDIDESSATGGTVSGVEVISTEGSANINGLVATANVNPIVQLSGTFTNPSQADSMTVSKLTEFTTAGNDIPIFVADNDYIVIGDAEQFQEVEILLATVSSGSGVKPTFEYSTGPGTWATFTPVDGTNGLRNNGVVVWFLSDVATWATGSGGNYLIRITRTANSLTTNPIESKIQISSVTRYEWDKQGDLTINKLNTHVIPGGSDTIALLQNLFSPTDIDTDYGIENVTSAWEFTDFTLADNVDATKEVTFDVSGISTATTRTYTLQDGNGTLAFTSDIVDNSTSNEGSLTATDGAGTVNVASNTSGSSDIVFAASGIATVNSTGQTITIDATEVDGSTSNELQTFSNTSDATSHTVTLSDAGGSVQLIEGTGVTLTTGGTGLDGTVTIAASGASGEANDGLNLGAGVGVFEDKVSLDLRFNSLVTQSSGQLTIAEDDPNNEIDFTIVTGAVADLGTALATGDQIYDFVVGQGYLTAEVDGDITNEGQLSVTAGTATTSIINSNTSGSGTVTLTAGTGLSIGEVGNVITLTNTGVVSEVNDLGAAVTWANVPDANITQSSVTQHQAALTITESQISDLSHFSPTDIDTDYGVENVTSAWEFTDFTLADNVDATKEVTFNVAGITTGTTRTITLQDSDGTLAYTSDIVDNSVSNEGSLTVTDGAGTVTVASNTSGSSDVVFAASGIATVNSTGQTITIDAAEVDGSISNELQTVANTSDATTHTVTLSDGGGSFQLVEGTGVTLTTTGTSSDGIVTIAASGASGEANDGTNLGAGVGVYEDKVSLSLRFNSLVSQSTQLTIAEDDPNNEIDFTINTGAVADAATTLTTGNDVFDYIAAQSFLTSEVDGDVTNEGSLTVGAGAANTSLISSNTSGSTDVTITAGTGLSISEAANVITLANTGVITETNDLTAAVTWANVPDANITQSSVTQHQAALSITESQISDLTHFSPTDIDTDYGVENVTSAWEFTDFTLADNVDATKEVTFDVSNITTATTRTYTLQDADGTIAFTSDIVDNSISNEGSLSVGAGAANTSLIQSNTSGSSDITLSGGTDISITETGNEITIASTFTEVDGSVSNEGALTATDGAGIVTVASNTSGSTDLTLTEGGIVTVNSTGNNITISATEVDGDATNELQTVSNTSDATSHTLTLSNSGGSIQLVEGSNITLTTSGTGSDGIVTIASTGGASFTDIDTDYGAETVTSAWEMADLTLIDDVDNTKKVTFDVSGITTATTRTYTLQDGNGTLAFTSDIVDNSVSNEGSLTVGAGTASTSLIQSNTSGSTDITLEAGSNITLSEAGNTITIASTGGASFTDIDTDYGAETVTSAWEMADLTLVDDIDNTKKVTFDVSGITTATTRTITLPDGNGTLAYTSDIVDNSVSNEGSLTVGAGAANTSLISSNTSGSTDVTLTAGTGLSIGEAGNVITLTNTGVVSEVNDLGAAVTWANVPDANITQSSVTQHEAALTITESQISDLQAYLTSEVDGDISNEGSLTATDGAGTVTMASNTSGSTDITFAASGIATVNSAGNTITVGATEVDGSVSNEGSLSVGTGTATTSLIQSNTSGSGTVTLTAGTGMAISEEGNAITLTGAPQDVGVDINTYTPSQAGSITVDFESESQKVIEINCTNVTSAFTMNVSNGWNTAGSAGVYLIRLYNVSGLSDVTVTLDSGDTWYDEAGSTITSFTIGSADAGAMISLYTTNGSTWYTRL